MNQLIKKSRGIEYIVVGIAVCIFLLIWPAGIIHETAVSKSDEVLLEESGPVSVANNITQMFIAEGNFLDSVDLYVSNEMYGETITFRVYDGTYTQLWEKFIYIDDSYKTPGRISIPVQMEMTKGWEYYYTVEGLSSDLYLNLEDSNASTSLANGTLQYGGIEQPGKNVITRYQYTQPFPWWKVIGSFALLFVLAAGIVFAVDHYYKKTKKDKEIRVQQVLQLVLNPLIIIATAYSMYQIFPGRVFGTGKINYGFYDLGILLFSILLLFGVNYRRDYVSPLFNLEKIKEHWPDCFQAFMFAGVISSCCEYMNGLYDIHHTVATTRMLIYFALAVIATYQKKEVLNFVNAGYLLIAVIASYFYYQKNIATEQAAGLTLLTIYMAVAAGFVIINTVRILVKRQLKSCYLPYTLSVVGMIALLVVFRNTRLWPIFTAAIFGFFYLRIAAWKNKDRLMENFCNGLILNFLFMILYCLQHRPFHAYVYFRYPMNFHTVTISAVYIALIFSAALVKFLAKYQKANTIKELWKEGFFLGVTSIYLFFTLSRTGILAAFAVVLLLIPLTAIVCDKKKIMGVLKRSGLVIAAFLFCFPIVFTATRILPAVTDDPLIFEIEPSEASINKGEPKDSYLYMDIKRFLSIAGFKLFDVNTEGYSFREPYILNQTTLLASADATVETEPVTDETNGRFDIFKEYMKYWNMTGHDEMGVPLADGSISVHAHDIYLQVIHDHGLPTGILFLLFGAGSLVLSMVYFVKYNKKDMYSALPFAVLTAFAVAGITEWIFHPCNPIGFSVFVVITPLLFFGKDSKKEKR